MKRKKNELSKIWITWEDDASIRSKVLAKKLNADFYVFNTFEGDKYLGIPRYIIAVFQTFFLLLLKRPDILVVQNPSIVLAFIATLFQPIFKYRLVIDLHTMYLKLKGIKRGIYNGLNNFALGRSHIVVVTNKSYGRSIAPLAGRKLLILPDRIPGVDSGLSPVSFLSGKQNILYICTFSEDEPWQNVIESANFISKDTCIYISGKNRGIVRNLPSNVVLTGFLPLVEYHRLLRSVDAVMVLTDQDDCLVCGGYEAVSVEKPLILSDQKALRNYFHIGTVFTEHDPQKIADAIQDALDKEKTLKKNIKTLKAIRKAEWEKQWQEFIDVLNAA